MGLNNVCTKANKTTYLNNHLYAYSVVHSYNKGEIDQFEMGQRIMLKYNIILWYGNNINVWNNILCSFISYLLTSWRYDLSHIFGARTSSTFAQKKLQMREEWNTRDINFWLLLDTGYVIVGNEQYSQSSVATINLFFFKIYKMNL